MELGKSMSTDTEKFIKQTFFFLKKKKGAH